MSLTKPSAASRLASYKEAQAGRVMSIVSTAKSKLSNAARLAAYQAARALRTKRLAPKKSEGGKKAKDPMWRLRVGVNASFRFVVQISGIPQGAFTECALPTIEWEVQEIKEGGVNTFVHELPVRRKSARVTLKNGLATPTLFGWYLAAMNEVFVRQMVTITLLDSRLAPVMIWNIEEARPVKWTGPTLNSSDASVAIQSLEISCGEITIIPTFGSQLADL
jgi:phage tail-like protein